MFKYLQRLPFLEENLYLRKAINEEIKIINSGWISSLKYILDSYGLSILIINIFKVVEGDISKKEYKNKRNFFQKRAKDCFIQENFFRYASENMNIFTQTKDQYKKETYLNLKHYDNRVAITKLRLSSHNLAINTAKWYKLPNDQKICRYCLRDDIENEMHVLFECDNYNALRQHTFKEIKTIDNIELDTGNKLQKLKILLSDGSLKFLNIFGKYIYGIFEARTTREKENLSYTMYLLPFSVAHPGG